MKNKLNIILIGIILNIFMLNLVSSSGAAAAAAAAAAASNNANDFNHDSSVAKGAVDFSIQHKCKLTAYDRYSINEFWCRDNDDLSNITSCYLKTNGNGELVEQRCKSVSALGSVINTEIVIVALINMILVVIIVYVASKLAKKDKKKINVNNMKGGKE